MTTFEFIKKINNGEAKVLTVEAAKGIKGKKINWMYFGYQANTNVVNTTIVGDIKGGENRLELLDIKGMPTYMYAHLDSKYYSESTFTCSDSDREVYYIVCE